MSDQWAQSEAERTAANFIRVGVITAVDLAHADGPRATMRVGGLDSAWLPWLVERAGDVRTGSTPSVGEQRVLFAPYGDTTQGYIGGAVYQDDHPSPATTAAQHVFAEFPDGTRVEYDMEAGKLQVDVGGAGLVVINCKAATVKADSVTLDTPETNCTGNLTVGGNATFSGGAVTHGGKNIGKDHTHSGVQSGGATTGAPV